MYKRQGYYNLVMQIKELKKQKVKSEEIDTTTLSDKQMNEIVERVLAEMQNNNTKNNQNEDEQEEKFNNDLNKDSFVSSFLNKVIEKF